MAQTLTDLGKNRADTVIAAVFEIAKTNICSWGSFTQAQACRDTIANTEKTSQYTQVLQKNSRILLINFLFPLTYSSGSDIAPGQIIFCARGAVFDARRNLPTLMDYQWAAWCITVAIGYVFGQVLLRHPELLRALQTIGVIYIKLYHFRSVEGRPTAKNSHDQR